eukprot:UN24381
MSYALSLMNLLDVLAILPFYLKLVMGHVTQDLSVMFFACRCRRFHSLPSSLHNYSCISSFLESWGRIIQT